MLRSKNNWIVLKNGVKNINNNNVLNKLTSTYYAYSYTWTSSTNYINVDGKLRFKITIALSYISDTYYRGLIIVSTLC